MSIKRYLVAAGAAGLVFSGVYGAAAALTVEGGNAQAGQDFDLACDEDGVTVKGYSIEQGTGLEPTSHGIVINGIADACDGFFVSARVLNAAGVIVGRGVKQILPTETGAGAVDFRITWTGAAGTAGVPVSQITTVSIAIT